MTGPLTLHISPDSRPLKGPELGQPYRKVNPDGSVKWGFFVKNPLYGVLTMVDGRNLGESPRTWIEVTLSKEEAKNELETGRQFVFEFRRLFQTMSTDEAKERLTELRQGVVPIKLFRIGPKEGDAQSFGIAWKKGMESFALFYDSHHDRTYAVPLHAPWAHAETAMSNIYSASQSGWHRLKKFLRIVKGREPGAVQTRKAINKAIEGNFLSWMDESEGALQRINPEEWPGGRLAVTPTGSSLTAIPAADTAGRRALGGGGAAAGVAT